MSTSEEKLFRAKEEARKKYELTGLTHCKCKNCGPLPINLFYLEKDKKGKYKPMKYCKKCCKKRRKSLQKTARRKYWKRANAKISERRIKDPNFAETRRKNARDRAKKARINLEDSYIIKLFCSHGEMKAKDVQPWMIKVKREEIQAERERLEKVRALKQIGIKTTETRKASSKKNREELSDCYVKQLLRLSGIKTKDITPEMIEEKRAHTKQMRENVKKNGKYASEAQKLSDNYLRLVVSSQKKIPKDQVSEEQMQEAKARIIERRERLGKEPKSAEIRIKFQYAKRNSKARNKTSTEK